MTDTIKISRELRPVLSMILNALDRDAAEGKAARGEMAAELRALLATPPADAADMGGQAGEEVEVMAYAVDHPEAGYKVYKQFSQWMNGGEWRCDSLMTVAQHQRIVAVISAQQSAHVSVPRELLERVATHLEWDGDESQTVIQYANKCDALAAELHALLNGGEA